MTPCVRRPLAGRRATPPFGLRAHPLTVEPLRAPSPSLLLCASPPASLRVETLRATRQGRGVVVVERSSRSRAVCARGSIVARRRIEGGSGAAARPTALPVVTRGRAPLLELRASARGFGLGAQGRRRAIQAARPATAAAAKKATAPPAHSISGPTATMPSPPPTPNTAEKNTPWPLARRRGGT